MAEQGAIGQTLFINPRAILVVFNGNRIFLQYN